MKYLRLDLFLILPNYNRLNIAIIRLDVILPFALQLGILTKAENRFQKWYVSILALAAIYRLPMEQSLPSHSILVAPLVLTPPV